MEQDQELLDRCLAGEDSAWESLLRGYTRKIYNLCYRFTGRVEEAEDVTRKFSSRSSRLSKVMMPLRAAFQPG